MFEAVHAVPDGDSTVSGFTATAVALGFDGIVVRNHSDHPVESPFGEKQNNDEIDIVDGVEIVGENPAEASGLVREYRNHTTVILVHGGIPRINRFAVEQSEVDVLAHPLLDAGGINHVLAKAAADNMVRLEVNLTPVLRSTGGTRVRAITGLRDLHRIIETYNVPFVVSGDPVHSLQLRSPRELRAVGEIIGFTPEEIEAGLAEWGVIAAENRDRKSESFIEQGVRYSDDSSGGHQ